MGHFFPFLNISAKLKPAFFNKVHTGSRIALVIDKIIFGVVAPVAQL
jgi:hypothetical protein